jgi:hypothetical protein
VHHGDLHAVLGQAVGRLQAQQAAAGLWVLAAASMVSTSAMSRKPITPCLSEPGIGMMKGMEPVASSRRS